MIEMTFTCCNCQATYEYELGKGEEYSLVILARKHNWVYYKGDICCPKCVPEIVKGEKLHYTAKKGCFIDENCPYIGLRKIGSSSCEHCRYHLLRNEDESFILCNYSDNKAEKQRPPV